MITTSGPQFNKPASSHFTVYRSGTHSREIELPDPDVDHFHVVANLIMHYVLHGVRRKHRDSFASFTCTFVAVVD
jgi:hypothetical protein